jgi:uncharacterized protein (DUF302 family)
MSLEWSNSLILGQPYDKARRRIRAALEKRGLQIAFDFDVAEGILRSAGVRLPKSCALGVVCPYQLLEAVVADGSSSVFLPLHVVLIEQERKTLVRLLAPTSFRGAGISPAISIPLHRTLVRIREVLASVDARPVRDAPSPQHQFEHSLGPQSEQERVGKT